jgi:hypothetical protein
MANLTITNNDYGSGGINVQEWEHDQLLALSGATTVKEFTILARKEVADAITATADVGNTGDGTVTLASVVAGATVPLVGNYNLECIEAVTNGGVFKLVDPNGAIVAPYLAMTPGALASTLFEVAGMTFTITDGAADFIVGDKFELAVAADGKLYLYKTDGIGGEQNPRFIITYEVVTTGAGNVNIDVAKVGTFNKTRTVIHADGDSSNITDQIVDELRDYGIILNPVTQRAVLDNQ